MALSFLLFYYLIIYMFSTLFWLFILSTSDEQHDQEIGCSAGWPWLAFVIEAFLECECSRLWLGSRQRQRS
jgi:hypothetical protein